MILATEIQGPKHMSEYEVINYISKRKQTNANQSEITWHRTKRSVCVFLSELLLSS